MNDYDVVQKLRQVSLGEVSGRQARVVALTGAYEISRWKEVAYALAWKYLSEANQEQPTDAALEHTIAVAYDYVLNTEDSNDSEIDILAAERATIPKEQHERAIELLQETCIILCKELEKVKVENAKLQSIADDLYYFSEARAESPEMENKYLDTIDRYEAHFGVSVADIIEQLTSLNHPVAADAADEIEALRQELKELRREQ